MMSNACNNTNLLKKLCLVRENIINNPGSISLVKLNIFILAFCYAKSLGTIGSF
jgi:hypothetical protein